MQKGDLVECIDVCPLDGCHCMTKGNIGICEQVGEGLVTVKWIHGKHLEGNEKRIGKKALRVITHGRN